MCTINSLKVFNSNSLIICSHKILSGARHDKFKHIAARPVSLLSVCVHACFGACLHVCSDWGRVV